MKNSLYNILLFCLVTSLAISPADASDSDVTVLASSDDGLHFRLEVNPGHLQQQTAPDSGSVFIRSIPVGIPVGSRVVVRAAQGFGASDFTKRTSAKATSIDVPLVRISPPMTIRGRQTVNVIIAPVQGGMVYREVEVDLGFDGGIRSESIGTITAEPFDRVFRAALVNYEQFKTWPAAVERSRPKATSGTVTATPAWGPPSKKR